MEGTTQLWIGTPHQEQRARERLEIEQVMAEIDLLATQAENQEIYLEGVLADWLDDV